MQWKKKKAGDFTEYKTRTITITASTSVTLYPFCNAWLAVNEGDTPCRVNGKLMKPAPIPAVSGEAWGASGNEDEFTTEQNGVVQVVFEAPIGTNPLIEFTQKYYLGVDIYG